MIVRNSQSIRLESYDAVSLIAKKVVCSIAFLCSPVVSSVFAGHHDVVPFKQKGSMMLSGRFEALQKIRLAERSSDGTEELFLVQGPETAVKGFLLTMAALSLFLSM